MDLVRELWASVSWLAVPLRVCLAGFVVATLALKLLPVTARWVGRALESGAAPTALLLTFPEYLATSICRRRGWPLLPGTYSYDRLLGAGAVAASAAGGWMARTLGPTRRFPRKPLLVLSAVVLVVWYVEPALPVGEPRATLLGAKCGLSRIDGWLATGEWEPRPDPAAAAVCPAAKPPLPPAVPTGVPPRPGAPSKAKAPAQPKGR